MIRLRRAWFQIHKWLGITLAILVIPISLTGAALVWHDWLDEQINPQRFPEVNGPLLEPGAYAAAAARIAEPGERVRTISLPDRKGAVQVTLTKPLPDGRRQAFARAWLNPMTAEPIERAGNREGVLSVLHVLHGSLMVPGVGRKIVGLIGLAMLLSSLTGLWLWWPLKGSVRRGLRWNRRPDLNSNLHFQAGFWVSLPLAVLSLTGVWISFPEIFSGTRAGGPPGTALQVVEQTNLSPELAVAAARPLVPGSVASIAWPTEENLHWTVTIRTEGKPREVKVADSDAKASLAPAKPETLARTMRRIHDGTGMPLLWQVIIFVGGILPALLAVTGILMWLRMRRRRARNRRAMGDLVEAEALAS
ncbi:MAG TPA: PepSY-associated TM helix domain-containing protein [Sphingomicrobium sp.]|nr:PepSY-associated TM helix domain-containing protein [Sphingomicrobium sp.]